MRSLCRQKGQQIDTIFCSIIFAIFTFKMNIFEKKVEVILWYIRDIFFLKLIFQWKPQPCRKWSGSLTTPRRNWEWKSKSAHFRQRAVWKWVVTWMAGKFPKYILGNRFGRPESRTVVSVAVVFVYLRHSAPNTSVWKLKFVSYLSKWIICMYFAKQSCLNVILMWITLSKIGSECDLHSSVDN
jgi:hypothetical protein